MVVETENFCELDFYPVYKIVSSSKSNIHTEVEVLNVSICWLKHKHNIRRKFAKKLFSKVRLHLLSEHALKHLLDSNSLLSSGTNYFRELKEVIDNLYSETKSNSHHTSRYCDRNMS